MAVWNKEILKVVVGILQKENKILVAQRPADKPYGGYWEFPGGKIELNESSLEALKRELHEELGIDVEQAELWFQHQHTYSDKTVLLEIWRVLAYNGKPQSQERQELRWVATSELLSLQILEGNSAIIDKIKGTIQRLLEV